MRSFTSMSTLTPVRTVEARAARSKSTRQPAAHFRRFEMEIDYPGPPEESSAKCEEWRGRTDRRS